MVCVFVLIHFHERFQIDAFSMKTLNVLVLTEGPLDGTHRNARVFKQKRISVDAYISFAGVSCMTSVAIVPLNRWFSFSLEGHK